MGTFKTLGIAGSITAALLSAQAFAAGGTVTCPLAPATGIQTQGSPVCIAPYGEDGQGTGLEDELNNIYRSSLPSSPAPQDEVLALSASSVKHGPGFVSADWALNSSDPGNEILFEIAGNKNVNSFGIYDPSNRKNYLELFGGPAGAGATTSLTYDGDGSYTADYGNGNTTTVTFGTANVFGYYLDTPSGFFYSNASLNQDPGDTTYAGGTPHMVAYQGAGGYFDVNGQYAQFNPSDYILAWEDETWLSSDLDYQDFVVMVEDVHPVPEPAVLGMFGFGVLLIGLFAGLRRRPHKPEPGTAQM